MSQQEIDTLKERARVCRAYARQLEVDLAKHTESIQVYIDHYLEQARKFEAQARGWEKV